MIKRPGSVVAPGVFDSVRWFLMTKPIALTWSTTGRPVAVSDPAQIARLSVLSDGDAQAKRRKMQAFRVWGCVAHIEGSADVEDTGASDGYAVFGGGAVGDDE